MRWALRVSVVIAVGGCGDDESNPPPVGVTSTTAGTATPQTDPSAQTSMSSSSAEESSTTDDSGPSPICRACWAATCDGPIDACLADEDCACRFGCDQDGACVMACPESVLFDALLSCIVDSSIDVCVDECEAHCSACAIIECATEFEACEQDDPCLCRVWCNESQDCDELCGAVTEPFETLGTCFGNTAEVCAGAC